MTCISRVISRPAWSSVRAEKSSKKVYRLRCSSGPRKLAPASSLKKFCISIEAEAMNYHFDFSFLAGSAGALLSGLKVTIELAVAANIMGLILGFFLCLLVMSRWAIVRWPAQLFVEFFRCTPALLQIIWFFYCIPMMLNVFIDPISMGVLALGLNLTAFN